MIRFGNYNFNLKFQIEIHLNANWYMQNLHRTKLT